MIRGHLRRLADSLKSNGLTDGLVRRPPLVYGRARELFVQLDSASLEEREAFAQRRLTKILGLARKTTYGRQIKGGTTLSEWPVLEKTLVRDHVSWFYTAPTWLASPGSTSGTTGLPVQLLRSPYSVVVEQAAMDHLMTRVGHDLSQMRIAVLRGDSIKDPSDREPPFWKFSHNERRMTLSSNHLAMNTIEAYWKALTAFKPDCLLAYPSSLEALCALLSATNRKLFIPVIQTSAEMLHPHVRELAVDTLHAVLIDQYGQGERVSFVYSLEPGRYYFQPGYAEIELEFVRAEGNEDLYEVIGTGLWNLRMPLIRYRTGDLLAVPRGTPTETLRAIRHGLHPFSRITGRTGDYLLSPDGARLMGIDHIPREVPHVVQMQFVQERRDLVRVLVVPTSEFESADERLILQNARTKIPQSIELRLEVVDSLYRTPAGKAPFVVRSPGV